MTLKSGSALSYIGNMKQILASLIVVSLSAPVAQAQEDDGLSLMEQGAQMFMEGILQQMEPTLKDLEGLADEMGPALRGFAEQMGPALSDLLDQVEDWSAYHPPEMLPNGDIIMRRKIPDEPVLEPDGSIDL